MFLGASNSKRTRSASNLDWLGPLTNVMEHIRQDLVLFRNGKLTIMSLEHMVHEMEEETDEDECGLDEETISAMEADDKAMMKDKFYLYIREDVYEKYGGVFVLLQAEDKEGQVSAKILQHKLQKGSQSDLDKLKTFLTKGGEVQDENGVRFKLVAPLVKEKDFPAFDDQVENQVEDNQNEVENDSDTTETQHSEDNSDNSEDGAPSATTTNEANESDETPFRRMVDEYFSASNKGKGKAKA